MHVWDERHAREIIEAHLHLEGPMLPILHALQAAFGYIPEQVIPLVAEALNVTRAEAYGVVTFYHDFRRAPAGRHVVKICRAEACQATGGVAAAAALLSALEVEWGGTTADGRITIEPAYCLGLCAVAPAALIDGAPAGRLDAERLRAAVNEAANA